MGRLNKVIQKDQTYVVPGPGASGNIHRLELTPRQAMAYRKGSGYVSNIMGACKMLNTDARCVGVIGEIVYIRGHDMLRIS